MTHVLCEILPVVHCNPPDVVAATLFQHCKLLRIIDLELERELATFSDELLTSPKTTADSLEKVWNEKT